jgi:hypothetical protein
MNMQIVLPKGRPLTLTQWMIKHKVSTQVCSLSYSVGRAFNSIDNALLL